MPHRPCPVTREMRRARTPTIALHDCRLPWHAPQRDHAADKRELTGGSDPKLPLAVINARRDGAGEMVEVADAVRLGPLVSRRNGSRPIVDDEPCLHEAVAHKLRLVDGDVAKASNGREGVNWFPR